MSSDAEIDTFNQIVINYYQKQGRHDLPWRQAEPDGCFDPYKIWLSEIMLQQTQVKRVIPKFIAFLEKFPTLKRLAGADLSDVLIAWNGLGYNRRAKFLWQAARIIVAEYQGTFPSEQAAWQGLPGIGVNTAGAIVAYAYDRPAYFIETNIRTVYIYHFFPDQQSVNDSAILELVRCSLGQAGHPREFYWALMDYGSHLKTVVGNLNAFSKSYAKQSRFVGSKRQIRGKIIRLLSRGALSADLLAQEIADERFAEVASELVGESLIKLEKGSYSLP